MSPLSPSNLSPSNLRSKRRSALGISLVACTFLPLVSLTSAAQEAAVDPFAGRNLVLEAHELRGLPGEVAALLLRAEPGGDLAFEINAVPIAGGERSQVPFFVEIDGAALLDRGQGVLGRVEVYAYALDATGKIGDFLVQAFTLDAEKIGEVLWQSGPRFQGTLRLTPGDYRLRILVRESQSKAAGLRELAIHIPPAAAAGTVVADGAVAGEAVAAGLGPALFEEPRERDSWIPVRAATPPTDGLLEESVEALQTRWQRDATDYPLTTAGRAMIPAALPVLASGSPLRIYLPAGPLPAGGGKAELLENGKVVAVAPLAPTADEARENSGSALHAFLLTPPVLPAGRYSLRVAFGATLSSPRDVLLVARETRDGELLWSDLRWRLPADVPKGELLAESQGESGKTAAAGGGDEKLRLRVGDVATRYRELVRGLPGQPGTVNVARLLEIEAQILQSDHAEAMTILQNAELRVAGELGDWDVETLVPLIHLHYESYLAYRQRRIFPLLTHSRILIDRLVGVYIGRAKSEGARRLAAQVLGGLGLEAEEGNMAASSRRFYQHALTLDPTARHALLGLASSEERQSHRDLALDYLTRLVESHPEFPEGYLRLGINEKYTRRDPRAHLAKAKNLPGPAWIRRLALEELARLDLDEAAAAADLLEAAPAASGELSTVALMAHLEDRRGRFARSLELARGAPLGKTESARRRYDEVSSDERRAALELLTKAAETRGPLLAEWAASKGAQK